MNIKLISITPNPEDVIEEAGRICYKSEIGDKTIIQRFIKSGHESMLEHANCTFYIDGVSRALSHQLVRHRIASYSQQSQRYVSENKFNFIIPPEIEKNQYTKVLYESAMKQIQEAYNILQKNGIKKEDARFLLPNACETSLIFTFNFRSLRNFLKLRLDIHAQWEIRELANEILKIIKPIAPNVFFDFEVLK